MTKKRCSVLTHGLISSLNLLNHVITRDLRQPWTDLVPRVLVHSTSGRKVRDSLDSARGETWKRDCVDAKWDLCYFSHRTQLEFFAWDKEKKRWYNVPKGGKHNDYLNVAVCMIIFVLVKRYTFSLLVHLTDSSIACKIPSPIFGNAVCFFSV